LQGQQLLSGLHNRLKSFPHLLLLYQSSFPLTCGRPLLFTDPDR
jgi:hypothetical protein